MTHSEEWRAQHRDTYRAEHMEVWAVGGIGEIEEGTDLGAVLGHLDLHDGDVVLVTSKIVSKAEGRVRSGDRATAIAEETVRVVARRGATSIVENRLGMVMAAAGVDASNVTPGHVLLLPEDPDGSARALRGRVYDDLGRNVAVILTDTAGRAWRTGQTDLAVGAAGVEPLDRLAGMTDAYGNRLEVTAPAVADELAAAAELVTGKLGGRPISVVRGLAVRVLPPGEHGPGARALLRSRAEDMFALGAREVVIAAVQGRDADCFGSPGTTEEVQQAMESCGLAADIDGVSVRVRLPEADERSLVRDQVVAVERVRLVAHAYGWRPHSDSATPDGQGDYVTVSPTAP